jgi:Delta7-sterol 5-desaturase
MDLVLRICDDHFFDKIWAGLLPFSVPRDSIPRQLISLCAITLIGIHVLYFLFAWVSYKFIFNHEIMKHPKFLKNQVKLEIQFSLRSIPVMTLLTLPWFQAEVMGYSKLYDGFDTYGYFYLFASVPLSVFPLSLDATY